MREGRHEVKEVGLVQALQEVIQLTIHSFQEPRGNSCKQKNPVLIAQLVQVVAHTKTQNVNKKYTSSDLPMVVMSVLY